MPKAFVIDRCLFCGALPCECVKSTARHPTKVQNTRRSAGPQKLDQEPPRTTTEPETPAPAESKPAPPKAVSIKSLANKPATVSARAEAVIQAGPAQVSSFGEAQQAKSDADFIQALEYLRPILHPEDPHASPEQRAALWRAQNWRARHVQ